MKKSKALRAIEDGPILGKIVRSTPGTATVPVAAPGGPPGVPIVELVKADLEARAVLGERKYGMRLKAHNGRDALQDAYEEALDLCQYLKQAIVERAKIQNPAPAPVLFPGKEGDKLRSIIEAVALEWKLSPRDLMSTRQQLIAEGRFVAMWLARKLTSATLHQIGEAMGQYRFPARPFDHGTILVGAQRCEEIAESNAQYRAICLRLQQTLIAEFSAPDKII